MTKQATHHANGKTGGQIVRQERCTVIHDLAVERGVSQKYLRRCHAWVKAIDRLTTILGTEAADDILRRRYKTQKTRVPDWAALPKDQVLRVWTLLQSGEKLSKALATVSGNRTPDPLAVAKRAYERLDFWNAVAFRDWLETAPL